MSTEPIAWCFRKSLVQKLQWHKPVGEESVLQHWTPLGDVSGLLAERDRLKAANAELAEALREVGRVFESNPPSITDTVWVTGNSPETLYDHCGAALTKHQGATA